MLVNLPRVEAQLLPRSLALFFREAWPILEPATPLIWGMHLDAMVLHLEALARGEIRNLLINVPPRHTKSRLCSTVFPVWVWLTQPEARFLTSSYSASLAIEHSGDARKLLESDWFQARWGRLIQLRDDTNARHRYENTRGGKREATSTDGTGTGKGGDFLIADDPHNVKKAESEADRASVLQWWRTAFSNRLNNARTGRRLVVMQRVHQGDLAGYLLAEGGWEHLCLPTEFEPARRCATSIGWKDPRTKAGQLLNPEGFGPAQVTEAKRTLGAYGYSGQHQQTPSPPGGVIYKRQHWRRWAWARHRHRYPEGTDVRFLEPGGFDEVVLSADTAITGEGDPVAIQVWGRIGADKFLLHAEAQPMDTPDTIRALLRVLERFPQCGARYVENKANGPAVAQMLKRKVPGLILVDPKELGGDKVMRARATQPQVEAGNVFLPADEMTHPWVGPFVEEHAAFPRATHDDQVDAQTMALIKLDQNTALVSEGEALAAW